MTKGTVNGYQARVNVAFLFIDKPEISIEFVVDTGFEGAMGRRPLLGTLLLRARNLNIDFVDGGLVRVERLEAHS